MCVAEETLVSLCRGGSGACCMLASGDHAAHDY